MSRNKGPSLFFRICDRLFGKLVFKLRIRQLHKYSASVYRLNKSIQRSDVDEDIKKQSQALQDSYVRYVALLTVGVLKDDTSVFSVLNYHFEEGAKNAR